MEEDNCQLLIDMGVSDLLAEIERFATRRGRLSYPEGRERGFVNGR